MTAILPEYIVMKKEYNDQLTRLSNVSDASNDAGVRSLVQKTIQIMNDSNTMQVSLLANLKDELDFVSKSIVVFDDLVSRINDYKAIIGGNGYVDVSASLRKLIDASNLLDEHKVKLMMTIR